MYKLGQRFSAARCAPIQEEMVRPPAGANGAENGLGGVQMGPCGAYAHARREPREFPAWGGFRGVESDLSMPQVIDSGHATAVPWAGGNVPKPPVVLATLSVRVDPNAERVAIESALETGTNLIVANMMPPKTIDHAVSQ